MKIELKLIFVKSFENDFVTTTFGNTKKIPQ